MDIKGYLKKKDGILVSDAIVAILIIMLFSGIIISLMTSIVLETKKIDITSQQIDFATKILEYTKKVSYADVTEENLNQYVNNLNNNYISAGEDITALTTPYKVKVEVQPYNTTEGNTDKLDLIKTVTLTIESRLRDKPYQTQIKLIKKADLNEIAGIIEGAE